MSRISDRTNAKSERDERAAADMARIVAFRTKAGLLHEKAPGFWERVAKAVGHRIGLPDEAPRRNALLVI